MQYLLTTIILCTSLIGFGQESATIKLVIKKFDHNQGMIRAGLYNSADQWLEKAFRDADTTIYNTEEVVLYFSDIPKGEYSISIYHDENDNGDLDTYVMGIPSEDYGFSNNAVGSFGPAKYADAAFQVAEKETIHTINLN